MNNNDNARLYVGNLPYTLRSNDLKQMFAAYGEVVDAVVMLDPNNRERSKGFGFVTMATPEQAEKAALAMNDREVEGRKIVCNIARPRVNN